MRRLNLLILAVPLVLLPSEGHANWQLNGTPVSTVVGDQTDAAIVADGAGGVIVAYRDTHNDPADIYVQRINASGVLLWAPIGVALCAATNAQVNPQLIPDGAGGAIVVWQDFRSNSNTDIYAQRINASGTALWTTNGVALCTFANEQVNPMITADGVGGAIVTWQDLRGGGTNDIYAQRINASGAVQWTTDGVALCTSPNEQITPRLISDGAGGAIVTWQDRRNGTYDIFAQRVNASGAALWTTNGVAVCTVANEQVSPTIAMDGAGGAIVAWQDLRATFVNFIYAQRINASGAAQWYPTGVGVSGAGGGQTNPKIVSDGAGGAVVIWEDSRSGNVDVYAQRVTSSGSILWTDGVGLCTSSGDQSHLTIAADGAGGAFVTWRDQRTGVYDIYVQRVDNAGMAQWTADGIALCTATGDQFYPTIVLDGTGGAVLAWQDYRNGSFDLYAQRLDTVYGYWGHPEPIVVSAADIPHDQGGRVAVNWTASGSDVPVPATIDFYSIWRAVDAASLLLGDAKTRAITPLERIARDTPPGVRTTMPSSSYYWELVGTQTAYRFPSYSFSAPTRSDSVPGNSGNEFFMVAAHDRTDPHIAFASNAVSGHSVDNVAPVAPVLLTAQRAGSDVHLAWHRVHASDLRDYAIYRRTSAGVTPVPINFLASAIDTVLTDVGAPTSGLYYIVTAYDVHQNQSPASNEASVGMPTNSDNPPTIAALTVLSNHPNPFSRSTELSIGLPKDSDLEIEVYDAAGRRVRVVSRPQQRAGWQRVTLDSRDAAGKPLVSGVYFYRVHANGTTITNKMVIER